VLNLFKFYYVSCNEVFIMHKLYNICRLRCFQTEKNTLKVTFVTKHFSVTTSRCISVGRVHFCGGGEAAGRRGEVTQEPAGRRAEGHSYRP